MIRELRSRELRANVELQQTVIATIAAVDPDSVFTKDEFLTNISLYWFTQTAASSARIYYESRHAPPSAAAGARIEVPTACADFPKEIIWSPRKWLEPRYNITRWTEMPKGGHFAAFEQPQLFVNDVRAFFREVR